MAQLTNIIPAQSFEVVRDRIAEILIDEFTNQHTLTNDESIDINVFVERSVAFNHTELPAINISVARGQYDNKSAPNSPGTYIYNIDCHHYANSTEENEGDSLASVRMQRLLGICRAVLENPAYNKLGFTPPFVSRVYISGLDIAQPQTHDTINVAMGRITLTVIVNEIHELKTPSILDGYSTEIKIASGETGYYWS